MVLLTLTKDEETVLKKSYANIRAKKDHVNPIGEHLIMSSINEVDGKWFARYFVGTRMDARTCDSKDEADLFIQNGIRSECGFGPLGVRGGLER